MSLKHIEQILKSNKTIYIINVSDSEQWLSNGYAAYPVRGLPKLTKENFLAVLNISDAVKSKFYIEETDASHFKHFSFDDFTAAERLLGDEMIPIILDKTSYRTFQGYTGLCLVPARYFKPFDDEDAEYQFYERNYASQFGQCIAVKKGLLLEGLILPEKIRNEATVEVLEVMSVLARQGYDNEQYTEPELNHTQLSIFKGEDEK